MSRLSIAIPSKGRLKEKSEDWLKAAGFSLRQKGGGRGYSAEIKGLPNADVMLLSASEIARELIAGNLHIGITGEDLLHDTSSDGASDFHVLRTLGFGKADLIVAVPQAWLDVDTMTDLESAGAQFRERNGRRMRVATKYLRLTRRFFAERAVGEYRLVESAGATEAAPATGSAEVVVDITSTGATLRANGLKILSDGVILKSQAALTASRRADWSDDALGSLRLLLDNIEAAAEARTKVRLETARPIPDQFVNETGDTRINACTLLCGVTEGPVVARKLSEAGLGPVIVTTVDHIFRSESAVYDSFLKNLSQNA